MEKGFSNRDINFATRDTNGFLWLLSTDIEKYDGNKITRYTRFDEEHRNPVTSINTAIQLNDSILIVSEIRDLYTFNMYTGQSSKFDYPGNCSQEFDVLINMVQKTSQPDILLTTSSEDFKSFHLVDTNWHELLEYKIPNGTSLSTKLLRSYAIGPSGVLWIMDQANDQVLRITAEGEETILCNFNNDLSLNYRIIYSDFHGLLIIRSDGLIDRIPPGGKTVEAFMNIPMRCNNLASVHFEKTGHMWLTCENMIVAIDLSLKSWNVFPANPFQGLQPSIHHIFEDEELTTWYCTEVGLIKVDEGVKPFHSALRGEPDERNIQFREIIPVSENKFICRVTQSNRNLLTIEYTGSNRIEIDTLFRNVNGTGLYLKYNDALYNVQSGYDYVNVYSLKDLSTDKLKLPVEACADYYNQFVIDHSGRLHYQDINRNITVLNLEDFSHKTVVISDREQFSESGGRVFFVNNKKEYVFGTSNNGLLICDSTGRTVAHYSTATDPALSSDFVNAIVEDKDDVYWAGTLGGGLNRLDIRNNKVEVFSIKDGLPNNLIASITKDSEDRLWIGTYYGLSRLDKVSLTFYNYFEKDGLPNNEFNYLAGCMVNDTDVVIGTFNGLVRFNPRKVIGGAPLPGVRLTGIQKYNRKTRQTTVQEYGLTGIEEIAVDPFDSYVEIEFALPAYRESGAYYYKTMLRNIDNEWQDNGQKSFVRFRQLPPGKYQLLVTAYDVQGNESIAPLAVDLNVRQVFYRSWWFFLTVFLSAAMLFYVLYRYRLNLVRKEANTRTRISVDLHDEIGSSLTRISLQLQMLERALPESAVSTLKNIEDVVDQSIVKLRDLVWTVDTSSDSWNHVKERMENFAYDVLRPRDIVFELSSENVDLGRKLKPLDKRNIYMIFKEAVNNIAKHSTGNKAEVFLRNTKAGFEITISNDTELKDTSAAGGGNGLKNMKMRAERIRGSLDHHYGNGVFTVSLKLDRNV